MRSLSLCRLDSRSVPVSVSSRSPYYLSCDVILSSYIEKNQKALKSFRKYHKVMQPFSPFHNSLKQNIRARHWGASGALKPQPCVLTIPGTPVLFGNLRFPGLNCVPRQPLRRAGVLRSHPSLASSRSHQTATRPLEWVSGSSAAFATSHPDAGLASWPICSYAGHQLGSSCRKRLSPCTEAGWQGIATFSRQKTESGGKTSSVCFPLGLGFSSFEV